MEQAEVLDRIKAAIPDAEIIVDGADCSFSVRVVSESFAGTMPVKRQQAVLGCFTAELSSGALHALTVQAQTPEEWKKQQESQLTQLSL